MSVSNWFTKILKRESLKYYKKLLLLAAVLVAISLFPWLDAWIKTPDGHTLWGVQPYNSIDTSVYFTYIEQVKNGAFFLQNFYTTENFPALFNPFWLAVGWLAKIFNLSPFIAYQVTRVLLIPVFLFVLDFFLRQLKLDEKTRWVATLLVVFSSGLGFLRRDFSSPDINVPEAITFYTLHHSPHILASLILVVLTIALIIKSLAEKRHKPAILAGLSAGLLFSFHPYYVPLIFAALAIFAAWFWYKKETSFFQAAARLLVIVAISSPPIFYYFFVMAGSEILRIKNDMSLVISPEWDMTLLGFGLLLPLSIWGWKKWPADSRFGNVEARDLVVFWFLATVALIYSPFVFQRRFFEGTQLALAVLAASSVPAVFYTLKKSPINRFILIAFASILLIGSNVSIYAVDLKYNDYLPNTFIEAATWIKNNTNEASVILSFHNTGSPLAPLALRKVWVGHGHETLFDEAKDTVVTWVFQQPSSYKNKHAILKRYGINYVFFGENEHSLGQFSPVLADGFEKVFENQTTQIYKVL